jgi:radical SAM protein with 4Fe4S-binding SPASM domain
MEDRFLRVYMDLNNKCNLRCRMCYFALDLSGETADTMDIGLFKKIAADVFPKALSVNLSCAAEPLIINGFPEFLKITKKYAVPQTLIVTNACFLDEKMARALIAANITQVDVSIDGATAKTYEAIRKGSDFRRVISNIERFQRLKKKSQKTLPFLYLDYALMKSNFREFPDFLKLAARLGADSVRANHLIPFRKLSIMKESLVNCKEDTNKMFSRARRLAKGLRMNVSMPPDFGPAKAAKKYPILNKPGCRVPFESMYIASDGIVLPCVWFGLKMWRAGDFKSQAFGDIWNGGVYERLRGLFNKGVYTDYCVNCPVYGDEAIDDYVFKERIRDDAGNICSTEF